MYFCKKKCLENDIVLKTVLYTTFACFVNIIAQLFEIVLIQFSIKWAALSLFPSFLY